MTSPRLLLLAAVTGPLAAVAAVVPFRRDIANTNAALVLVLVVVAVAAGGDRRAGVLATVCAGLSFDLFLTQPYQSLAIAEQVDAETTSLLVLIGVAVTELAVWGRRQQAEVSRRAGYEQGISTVVQGVSDKASPSVVIDQVCAQITQILDLHRCRFDYGHGVLGGNHPRLQPDGQVEVDGTACDVDRYGLPHQRDIEFLLHGDHGYRGRFVMTAVPGSRPSMTQRLAAVTLAERAGAALAGHRPE